MGKKTTSKRKQEKYGAHPAIAKANKVRKLKKQIKKQPNDLQAQEALKRHGG